MYHLSLRINTKFYRQKALILGGGSINLLDCDSNRDFVCGLWSNLAFETFQCLPIMQPNMPYVVRFLGFNHCRSFSFLGFNHCHPFPKWEFWDDHKRPMRQGILDIDIRAIFGCMVYFNKEILVTIRRANRVLDRCTCLLHKQLKYWCFTQ